MSTAGAGLARAGGRPFAVLAGAVLLLGLADSLVGAYFVLFFSEDVRLSPLQVGLLFSLPSLGGIACSVFLGRRFDRRPTRAWVLVSAISSAVGYVLLTTTTSFAWLLIISVVFFAAYQAAYPQLFSLSRHVLGAGAAGQRAAPLLRSAWALAWAVGPLAGAALVPLVGFRGVLFLTVALLLLIVPVIATLPSLRAGRTPEQAPRTENANVEAISEPEMVRPKASESAERPVFSPTGRLRTSLLTASIALFFTTMFAGSLAFPLLVTRTLGEPSALVGAMYSLCAVVEIITALGLVVLGGRFGARSLVTVGIAALTLHFVVVHFARDPVMLMLAQVPRGVAVTVVATAGILYFQDAMAPATGFATTLFSSASDAGFLLSGVAGGWAVEQFGPLRIYEGLSVGAVVAAVLFIVASARRRPFAVS